MSDILVGFIDRFDFTDESSREKLSGHPKVGGVYQILNLEGTYHIHIGHENTKANLDGITLGDSLSGNYLDKWSFNVVPLDKQNFVDYPLSVDDMDKVATWIDTDHKELRSLLNKPMSNVIIADVKENGNFDPISDEDEAKLHHALSTTLGKHFPITKQLIQSVSNNLNILVFHNPELLEAINESLTYLADQIKIDAQGMGRDQMSEEFLLFSQSKDTAIYTSIDNLYKYAKEEGDSKESLFKALQYGFLELQRRKLQSHE